MERLPGSRRTSARRLISNSITMSNDAYQGMTGASKVARYAVAVDMVCRPNPWPRCFKGPVVSGQGQSRYNSGAFSRARLRRAGKGRFPEKKLNPWPNRERGRELFDRGGGRPKRRSFLSPLCGVVLALTLAVLAEILHGLVEFGANYETHSADYPFFNRRRIRHVAGGGKPRFWRDER